MEGDSALFVIRVTDVQAYAQEKLGRELTYEELQVVKKGLEWGLCEGIDIVYEAIFEELKKMNELKINIFHGE